MTIPMSIAFRSPISPPPSVGYDKPCQVRVEDKVQAPRLQLLADVAEQRIKCGGITKSGSITKSVPLLIVYELYPPKRKRERWFCQFIKNIDDKTFLGRWYIANSTTSLDGRYAKPVVFEWCTVKCRVH